MNTKDYHMGMDGRDPGRSLRVSAEGLSSTPAYAEVLLVTAIGVETNLAALQRHEGVSMWVATGLSISQGHNGTSL